MSPRVILMKQIPRTMDLYFIFIISLTPNHHPIALPDLVLTSRPTTTSLILRPYALMKQYTVIHNIILASYNHHINLTDYLKHYDQNLTVRHVLCFFQNSPTRIDYIVVSQMRTINLTFIFFVLSALSVVQSDDPQIVDFTYAHVLRQAQNTHSSSDPIKIKLTPKSYNLQFPAVCSLQDKLNEGSDESTGSVTSVDDDKHIQFLRTNIIEMLKIAEEISSNRAMIEEIQSQYDLSLQKSNQASFESDLKQLQQHQSGLAERKNKIDELTENLNKKLEAYNQNPKGNKLDQIGYHYQIGFAENKLLHYRKLKNMLEIQAREKRPFNYQFFFDELNSSIQDMHGRLTQIDTLIGNQTHRRNLNQKLANLRNKIQIDRLTLNEKINCNSSRSNIRSRSHLNEQIFKIFTQLREKKQQFKGMNNTHCEGVAKKLEDKIRSWLKIINRAYICSEGLPALQQKFEQKKLQETLLEQQIKNISLASIDQQNRNYEIAVQKVNRDLAVMKTFSIDSYSHSIPHIQALIAQTEEQKAELQNQLSMLPVGDQKTLTFAELEALVRQIKREKAKYCLDYDTYEEKSREIWGRVHKHEKRERQRRHIREHLIKYSNRVLDLQARYENIAGFIEQHLGRNQLTQ